MTAIVKRICTHALDKPQGVVRFYNIDAVDAMTAKRYTFKTKRSFLFKYDRQQRLVSSVYTIRKHEHDAVLHVRSRSKVSTYKITIEEFELLRSVFEEKNIFAKPQIALCLAYKKNKTNELRIIITIQKEFVLQQRIPGVYVNDGWSNLQIATSIDEVNAWKGFFKDET